MIINRYYATLRTLDKKGLIVGASEKNGNMPFRTVYSISEKGKEELRDTLTKSILSFDYDAPAEETPEIDKPKPQKKPKL